MVFIKVIGIFCLNIEFQSNMIKNLIYVFLDFWFQYEIFKTIPCNPEVGTFLNSCSKNFQNMQVLLHFQCILQEENVVSIFIDKKTVKLCIQTSQ